MHTVGKLAKRFGLSRSTLLYYERIGLLRPSVHTKGDYRYYSDDDAERLARICSFREAGVSLADIATILAHSSVDAIDTDSTPENTLHVILSRRLGEIGQEMQLLSHQRNIITRLIQQPAIDDALPLTKESWTAILAACGFSTEDMRRWHIDFERTAPEKHERFLALLGIPNDERQYIRAWSAAPHEIIRIQRATEKYMEAFYALYDTDALERHGPGSVETTDAALTIALASLAPSAAKKPAILDIGCGCGAHAIQLALRTEGHITAVDNWQPSLERTMRRAEAAGVSSLITTVNADMNNMPLQPAGYDLIWSEGSAYIMGLQNALENWKQYLKADGVIAVSEAVWLNDMSEAPEPVVSFWKEGYPAMTTVEQTLAIARSCGFRIVDSFTLPPSCWTDEYYIPLQNRLHEYKQENSGNPDAEIVREMTQREIDVYTQYGDWYSYMFMILQPEQ